MLYFLPIDSVEEAANDRLSKEGLLREPPNVDFRVGNFRVLPWEDASFNTVIDIESLYANKMVDIRACVTEIQRVLKPGGFFFGKLFGEQTTGNHSGEKIEPGTFLKLTIGPCAGNDISHFFKREELEELFSEFRELSIDQSFRTDHNGNVEIFEWVVSARI